MLHLILLKKLNGSLKGGEIAQFCHINAIAIGVPDLRRGRDHHNSLRSQSVEYFNDALF